jgi:hypothetical protein
MARVKIPSSEKIAEYKGMICNRHQKLHDVWCTMNGLKITPEQSGDALIQEQYYNGWIHVHYVSSVICFCPNGTIPMAIMLPILSPGNKSGVVSSHCCVRGFDNGIICV